MSVKTFLDTNILVYAVDNHEPVRQRRARSMLTELQSQGTGVLSTQVLQEFYVVAVRKLEIEPPRARELVTYWARFDTVVVDLDTIRDGIDCSMAYCVSFWDGLIVAAAEKARCRRVWTEDLSHGQTIRGIAIENPFRVADR